MGKNKVSSTLDPQPLSCLGSAGCFHPPNTHDPVHAQPPLKSKSASWPYVMHQAGGTRVCQPTRWAAGQQLYPGKPGTRSAARGGTPTHRGAGHNAHHRWCAPLLHTQKMSTMKERSTAPICACQWRLAPPFVDITVGSSHREPVLTCITGPQGWLCCRCACWANLHGCLNPG